MNATLWKLRVSLLGSRGPIFVGPVFAASGETVRRRAAALLRRTALCPVDAEIPFICDRVLDAAVAIPEYCTLYDLSCFASHREPDYFSCSRFTRDLPSFRAFLHAPRGAKVLEDLRSRYSTQSLQMVKILLARVQAA
jgi:hypothetical protein